MTVIEVKGCDGIRWYKVRDFEKGVYLVEEKELKLKELLINGERS